MTNGFFTEEQQRDYDRAFPGQAQAGPSGLAAMNTPQRDTGKAKAGPKPPQPPPEPDTRDEQRSPTPDTSDYEDWKHHWKASHGTAPQSGKSTPEPVRMTAPPPVSFSAPLRTSFDMPIRGSKEAPKTFKGKYTEIQAFIDHYEQLLHKCRVTSDKEKCEKLLNYCSMDVQNVIQTMDCYEYKRWSKLRREMLKHYDAERVLQCYKPVDVQRYAIKARGTTCYSLTQWRKYYVKYNTIAGGPLRRGTSARRIT